jgi:hypothetical protein
MSLLFDCGENSIVLTAENQNLELLWLLAVSDRSLDRYVASNAAPDSSTEVNHI